MRNLITGLCLVFISTLFTSSLLAQQPSLQYFRTNDRNGLNVFETPKDNEVPFEGLQVRIGGDFALQFQGLSQSNDFRGDTLVELSNNFNLPTANLNFDVQLADGMRMHLRTYLSSRHHSEAWVKGGYVQIDKLDFISEGFLSGLMDFTTLRFGMDEINYGDTHFRRSDNARAIFNPFVGNYIMDAFSTEPFAEVTFQKDNFIGVVGVSNGRLNQSPKPGDDGISFYGKLGYDEQVNDDIRFRLTASYYASSDKSTRDYLYNGDRAGSRYYEVMNAINEASQSDFEPRFNPGYAYQNAFMINPFVKIQGLELFGVFEVTNNGNSDLGGGFTHIGAELLYRFGADERIYLGGRYNSVTGEIRDGSETQEIRRINVGGGFFMTDNILAKVEYVTSEYKGDGYLGTKFQGAEFNGVVIEAVVGF